jgi:TLD.
MKMKQNSRTNQDKHQEKEMDQDSSISQSADIESHDDMPHHLLETHPFSLSQLKLLLRLHSLWRSTGRAVQEEAEEAEATAERQGDDKTDNAIMDNSNCGLRSITSSNMDKASSSRSSARMIEVSSVVKNHPAIHWIEHNLPLVQPLSCYIEAFYKAKESSNGRHYTSSRSSTTDSSFFLEAMAILTGRRGSPLDTLATVYYSILCAEGSVTVTAENLLGSLYQIALASHVLLHWDEFAVGTTATTSTDHDNNVWNLEAVKYCALHNSEPCEMIASLKQYQMQQSKSHSRSQQQNTPDLEALSSVSTVKCPTFLKWADTYFPHMGSLLSTYLHLALFSCRSNMEWHMQQASTHHDDDDNEDKLCLYALGNRNMFEFPTLYKMELQRFSSSAKVDSTSSKTVSEDKESKGATVTVTPTDSVFLSNPVVLGSDDTSRPQDDGGGSGAIMNHLAFSLSLMETRLSDKWYKLYSTETDGFSFLNLQRNMMGYTAPTIMLIRPTEASMHGNYYGMDIGNEPPTKITPGLFGFYTANPWKESNHYYGTSDCCLFRAEPTVHVYRPLSLMAQDWYGMGEEEQQSMRYDEGHSIPIKTKIKENYMYFYPSAGHVNAGGHDVGRNFGIYSSLNNKTMAPKGSKPRGLVLGGSEQDPRIYITESFERCIASNGGPRDDTFESGPLLPGQWDKFFNVGSIEVWGVGGEHVVREAMSMKEKQVKVYDATRRRVQRVDKSQFLEDFQSGLHIRETRGSTFLFQHRLDGTARHDFDGGKYT